MAKKLLQKVDAIRRRAIVLVWTRAICLLIVTLYLTLMLIVLLDWSLKSDSISLRFGLFGAAILALVFALFRWLFPAINYRPDEVSIARRVELAQGGWQDELSTSVQLAKQHIQTKSTSGPWQASLIQSSFERLKPVSTGALVKIDTLIKPIGLLLVVAAVGGSLFAAWKHQVGFSLNRILQPWAAADWPRENDLVLEAVPDRVSRGDSIAFQVRDKNNHLTDGLLAEIQKDGHTRRQSMALTPVPGKDSTFAGRLNNLQNDTWLRARGGDDLTAWHLIEVVDAPQLAELKLAWQHPEINDGDLQPVDGTLRCWPDSALQVEGQANMPLSSATFVQSNSSGIQRTPLSVIERIGFRTVDSFPVLRESGSWWLELRSQHGVDSIAPERFEFQVMVDQPPVAIIESLDKMTGVKSLLPISITLHDEMPIDVARLDVYRNDFADESRIERLELTLDRLPNFENEMLRRSSTTVEIDLADSVDLKPGDHLLLSLSANDRGGNVPEAIPLRLAVTEAVTLQNLAGKKTRQLGQQLRDLGVQQSLLIKQTDAIRQRGDSNPDPSPQNLLRVATNQERLLRQLDAEENSAWALSQSILQFIQRHRLEWSGRQDVESVWAIQKQLRQQILPEIRNSLKQIDKSLSTEQAISESESEIVGRLMTAQQMLLEKLEKAAGILESSLTADQIVALTKNIRDEMIGLLDATAELNQQNLNRAANDLPDAISRLLNRQSSANGQAERLARQLEDIANIENETTAERVTRTRDVMRQDRLLTTLRDAETTLTRGQLGQTIQRQQQVVETLARMVEILDPQSDSIGPAVQPLTLTEQINQIVEQLQGYKKQLDDLANSDTPMSADQRKMLDDRKAELQQQLTALRNAIEASQFSGVNDMIQRASDAVASSTSSVDPRDMAGEANDMAQAIDQLQKAALEIARQSQSDESESNDLSKILELLVQLQLAQTSIMEWSEQAIAKTQSADKAEANRFQDLQRRVRAGFQPVQQGLQQYPTASILTSSVSTQLTEAESRLQQSVVDLKTVRTQRRIIADMQLLREAIEIQMESNRRADEVESEDSSENETPSAGISSFELTMLYVMQKGLQQETEQWQSDLTDAGEETATLKTIREALALRQQEIATVLDELLQKAEKAIPQLPDF